MHDDSGNVVRPGALHAVGVKTLVLQLQLLGGPRRDLTFDAVAADAAVCARRLAKHKPHVERQCCPACECHTKQPNMHPVLVSLPLDSEACCTRNNASMAGGPEMSQCTPDFQGQLLHCIVQPLLSPGDWRGA